ncbi:MAG: hypothetical protein E4H36_01100 [Spirochaetales bacterium]|nr:MAG: hypothetical protein E4H36_01100 [Spirochaetales bacterium]
MSSNQKNWGKKQRYGRYGRRDKKQAQIPKEPLPEVDCGLCEKPITNIHSAISHKGAPIHLDCAIALIQQQEPLNPDERVCYIGGGAFGILSSRSGNQSGITIKKRIQFEEKDQKNEWRKNLSKFIYDRIVSIGSQGRLPKR